MNIDDKGELSGYETMPKERTLYLTAVRYSSDYWGAGPSGTDKAQVEQQLSTWVGIDAARIYAVKVPVTTLPAA